MLFWRGGVSPALVASMRPQRQLIIITVPKTWSSCRQGRGPLPVLCSVAGADEIAKFVGVTWAQLAQELEKYGLGLCPAVGIDKSKATR